MYKRIVNNRRLFHAQFDNLVKTNPFFKTFFEKLKLMNNQFKTQFSKRIEKLRRFMMKTEKNSKINRILPFCLCAGMLLFERQKEYRSRVICYKATNKELDKVMANLEAKIKNLEFKYHGKLRRQPIK